MAVTGTRLALAILETEAEHFVHHTLATATQKVYRYALTAYLLFCHWLHLVPLPASEDNLLLFDAELPKPLTMYASIHTYMAGIRNLHIVGHGNPISSYLKLDRVIKEVHRLKPKRK